jgi:hypothetical protein
MPGGPVAGIETVRVVLIEPPGVRISEEAAREAVTGL